MLHLKVFHLIFLQFLLPVIILAEFNRSVHSNEILSRKRRYVAFPEGSSLSAALCTTIGSIGNPNVDFLSYAINWGVAYDLPNETWAIQAANGFKNHPVEPKPLIQRRYRRDLYQKIEIAIESMGYNGRDCILRALCESSNYFFQRTGNMIEELVKTIFSFPKTKISRREHRATHHYDKAYGEGLGLVSKDCDSIYPKCGFSLLELALGKYSTPNPIYSYM